MKDLPNDAGSMMRFPPLQTGRVVRSQSRRRGKRSMPMAQRPSTKAGVGSRDASILSPSSFNVVINELLGDRTTGNEMAPRRGSLPRAAREVLVWRRLGPGQEQLGPGRHLRRLPASSTQEEHRPRSRKQAPGRADGRPHRTSTHRRGAPRVSGECPAPRSTSPDLRRCQEHPAVSSSRRYPRERRRE